MSKVHDLVQQTTENPSPFLKAVNWVAAFFGIGSALGFINLIVGVLSAAWLSVQLYGYIRYELPHKRAKLRAAKRHLDELLTGPGDL